MKPFVTVVTLIFAICTTAASVQAQYKMTTYQLVILKKGPSAGIFSTPEGQKLVKEHVAHIPAEC